MLKMSPMGKPIITGYITFFPQVTLYLCTQCTTKKRRADNVVTVSYCATVADFINVLKCRKTQNHHLSKDNTN